MNAGRPLDIAIVGLGCRFPGARDAAAFWEDLVAARDRTGDVPPDRWDPAVFFDPDATANDRVYCRRGGYLDGPIDFDPAAYGIMPRTVEGGEPEQFLVLDAARAALADAGLADGVPDGRRVQVVIGRGNYFNRGNLTRLQHGRIVAQTVAILRMLHPEWTDEVAEAVRADLKASLPPFGPETIPGQLTNATAGRVADRLDLAGASFVVDAASASSLVALDLGARALVDRHADLALVGGVYLAADVDFPMVFCQLGALSRSGRARPFARDADGTLPGEGVGVVVLKRLRDAERDGDRVYAVLKGVGLASDGRGCGLASPGAKGHARAIRRAYRRSGIDPASVGLVEGHGLGVPASDRAELRALRAVFPMPPRGRRTLGAVSALIGHAMPAAGMAALIKTALALHHRVLPPSPVADPPHPLLADEGSPFALSATARPWIHGDRRHPRRAGVNAFGFAGINAHAVLEEHARSADGLTPGCQTRWETEAILLGAPDRAGLIDRARGLLDWLERDGNCSVPLKDLAFTINVGQAEATTRAGLVASSPADLGDRLKALVARLVDPACRSIRDARGAYFWEQPLAGPGTLAFLFPGEGSQYPGMMADLCAHFPEVRALFDTADRVALERGHARLPSEVLFGGSGDEGDGLWTVGTAINVVLSGQWALHQLLMRLGLRPDAVVGHSSGEFLALAASGAMQVDRQLEDRLGELGLVFEDLDASGRVPGARLVAVAADRAKVERACREVGCDGLTIAIDNCPHQVVVAGPADAAEAVMGRLRGRGVICEPLPFDRAYHTPAFAEALGPVRAFFEDLSLSRPRVPIYSCAIAGRMADRVEAIRRLAIEQWALPVAFRSTIEAMHADGIRVFVEVGARGNLTGFVEDILRGRPHFAAAANLPRRSGLTQLNHLMASLYAQGVVIRPDHLYARRRPVRIDLDRDLPAPREGSALKVGFPEMRLSAGLVARLREPGPGARHDLNMGGSQPLLADRLAAVAPGTNGAGAVRQRNGDSPGEALAHRSPPPPIPRDGAVEAYLRTMDAFLEAQHQVMDAYRAASHRPTAPRLAPEAPPGSEEPGPWVGTIQRLEPGRALVALRTLDPRDDPVAEHHTLGGRRVSALDPGRKGLPVVPFAVMAEMLAQAAAMLMPGLAVVALRDVQAYRWIRYEEDPVSLELRADRDPARPDEVRVAIHNKGSGSSRRDGADRSAVEGPVVAGRVVFGDARAAGPIAPPFVLEGAGTCRFTAGELYADQWLFHGPALQALVRVGPSSPCGIEGTLKVLPRRGLLRASDRHALRTDPIVVDAFTHLLGCWGLDQVPDGEGDVIFPLRVADLAILGADPPEGAEVACRIMIRDVSRHRVLADADLVGPDGRLWMRITGWEDWRFYWPSRYRDQFRQPDRVFVGEPLFVPGAGPEVASTVRAVWLAPPADMGRPVWRDVLEWVQLGPEERAACRALPGPEARRTLRLWGRIAAKEAARRLWADRGGPPVFPADLAIEPDPRGRPRLRSLLEPDRDDLPAVSIAHAEGVAVALAALDPAARVGVDVEPVIDRSPGFEAVAFREDERAQLDRLADAGHDREEWVARFWCAREAVAKATGLGMLAGPLSAAIVGVDPRTGEIAVVPGPELLAVAPDWENIPVRAVTARRGDFVWAWTLGEGSRLR
ncbi:MAG: acyltransferase domain-containing protein [Planctomycetaceae bacterium]|nr:acyltransferase domain-containing protein [Planctomycetaceae bacterium]